MAEPGLTIRTDPLAVRNVRGEVLVEEPGREVGTYNGFVGMFDFLGFRQLLTSGGLNPNTVLRRYDQETSLLVRFLNGEGLTADIPGCHVARFADTIVVVSETGDGKALKHICGLGAAIIAACNGRGIPIRGGIADGHFWANWEDDYLVGPALVDAHQLEAAQDWAGGALRVSDSTGDTQGAVKDLLAQGLLVDSRPPFHEGRSTEGMILSLGWPEYLEGDPVELAKRLRTRKNDEGKAKRQAAYEFCRSAWGSEACQANAGSGALHLRHASGNQFELASRWADEEIDEDYNGLN